MAKTTTQLVATTTTQLVAITTTQLVATATTQLVAMTTTQLVAITPRVCTSVPQDWWIQYIAAVPECLGSLQHLSPYHAPGGPTHTNTRANIRLRSSRWPWTPLYLFLGSHGRPSTSFYRFTTFLGGDGDPNPTALARTRPIDILRYLSPRFIGETPISFWGN